MERFEFLTPSGINYISYKKEKLYRYTSSSKVLEVNYMPHVVNDKKWQEFEKTLNERLCSIINRNGINSGLKGQDLDSAIRSIRDWIMDLQDNSMEGLTSLPDRKEMLEEIYNIIKGIIDFAKEQKKNYTFEQEWKERWW